MRFFLPLAAADLGLSAPPRRSAYLVEDGASPTKEGMEIIFERALEEASFRSLERVVEYDLFPARIVACGDTPAAGRQMQWDQVESLHVDGAAGQALIARAQQTQTQEELDQLTAEIAATPLEWFDVTEMPLLAQTLRP